MGIQASGSPCFDHRGVLVSILLIEAWGFRLSACDIGINEIVGFNPLNEGWSSQMTDYVFSSPVHQQSDPVALKT